MAQRPIIVFDVNETLLDLETIRPTFDRIFDDPAALRLWFAGLITYSEALTLAGLYVPFTDIGGAVLRMMAATRDIAISDADSAELTDRFASMPPHPEVPAALRRLRDHVLPPVRRRRQHARDLRPAAGDGARHRPVRATLQRRRNRAAPQAVTGGIPLSTPGEFDVDPGDICLGACHACDMLAALAAGWQPARSSASATPRSDLGPQPNYIGADLDAIADQLIARDGVIRTPSPQARRTASRRCRTTSCRRLSPPRRSARPRVGRLGWSEALDEFSATKPPAQVKVGDRVTIRVKIRNQRRRNDYVFAELHLQPASPLPFSPKENMAYGTRSVAAGHGPRSLLKAGQSGKAKLVWKVPKVHRGFDGQLVACAAGSFPAKAGQCRAIGRIHVSGSLLSLRAGVSATSSLPGMRASIGLAAQELASDGRGVWWAGPERWTAAATVEPAARATAP